VTGWGVLDALLLDEELMRSACDPAKNLTVAATGEKGPRGLRCVSVCCWGGRARNLGVMRENWAAPGAGMGPSRRDFCP
jgi:hypothetical protein